MRPTAPIFDVLNGSGGNAELLAYGAARKTIRNQGSDAWNIRFDQFLPTCSFAGHVRARNMFPVFASNDLVNGLQANAVMLRNVFSVFAAGDALKNVCDLFFRKFCRTSCASSVSFMKSSIISVFNIFCPRNPFKIARPVIVFIAIDVIDLMLGRRRRANKCLNNEAMNHHGPLLPSRANWTYSKITARIRHWVKDAVRFTSWTSGITFDAPKATCRVKPLPAGDRLPYLYHG